MIKSRRVADILRLVSTKTIHKMKSRDQNVFECKTCGRLFSSFQALGGHRTSHKRRARAHDHYGDGELFIDHVKSMNMKKKKKERHECPVCGVEFLMGQALGGHMRRHNKAMAVKGTASSFLFDLNLTPLENDLRI
ncbi:hypothetical protein J5N97_014962 [Dioscorea zingiberensis]|uniref:C2H2-type domain-containing protein n=1 Tax=Dioscorea zingiberensis TaxID=325984 RepID=A0A9D5HK93_9LILI|nr:hypothetical protein J5N97_014962 [Dioscorea zingiberensis]